MDSRLKKLVDFMNAEDWENALRLAGTFPKLGDHRDVIKTAHGAITNPRFYAQIGKDPQAMIDAGIVALKEKFSEYSDYNELIDELQAGREKDMAEWENLTDAEKKQRAKSRELWFHKAQKIKKARKEKG